jgi:alkylhydroperoxidase/carboxymuconolactone decarboxylase family protein YurZ
MTNTSRRDPQAVKYRTLLALAAAAENARAVGASEAEIAEALRLGAFGGAPPARRRPLRANVAALWAIAIVVGALLFLQAAPAGRADVCGDGAQAANCQDPAPPGLAKPPWLGAIQGRDPQFVDSYMAMRERILKDGAIPAKYKLLMAMVTDAIAAHPDGVKTLAGNARAAGASEPEVTEAVEVGYLFGGTAALVMGANAFNG